MTTEENHRSLEENSERIMREPCRPYLDTLMYCFSPSNQVSTYYRKGTIDDCSKATSQLKLCLRLKLDQTDEDRKRMHLELQRRYEFSPTATVWEMRKSPEEDWNSSISVKSKQE
jgi:hypothetical protein